MVGVIWLLIFPAVYVVGVLLWVRYVTVSFRDPKPGDELFAALAWPVLLTFIAWCVWTRKATLSHQRSGRS